ncbi:MAG: aromatic amino acid ammonia-lyase [Myxococcaceae bacterium]|nr:aromatic amino acid ammonia-lyase [Myxococcaceae bacterium]
MSRIESVELTNEPQPDWDLLVEAGRAEAPWPFSQADEARVNEAWQRLERLRAQPGVTVYGLHTGFGNDVTALAATDAVGHQLELLDYLCVGTGPKLPTAVVRRALRLQAFKAARGLSGTHPETVKRLLALASADELPSVPAWGSLGASGDLVPMAHAVAPVFERTEGRREVPGPRDVLSLVNTNAMMASFGIELAERVSELLQRAHEVTAAAALGLGFDDEPFRPDGLEVPGQDWHVVEAGRAIVLAMKERALDSGARPVLATQRPLQARYSVRCAPQVLGGSRWALAAAKERLLTEALRVADNPLVLEGPAPAIWHGGHFYALGVAHAADLMADVVFRVVELVDRQVLLLMDPATNQGLPRNLEAKERSHVKGLHQLLSALGQRLRGLAMPSRVMSFSCEGNNQDVVPCGMNALSSVQQACAVADEGLAVAELVTDRALLLRAGRDVPEHLTPAAWRRRVSMLESTRG